ncbi:MAG: MFS transporter [Bryobacteraceae bacterium]
MASVPAKAGLSLVAFLWIAFALNYVDRQMVYSIFPVLKTDVGFTDAQLGLIGSVFSWAYTISMPIAGRVADLFRRDRMIILSIILWSAATLGSSLSGSVLVFLFWRAVMGITESLYYPAAMGTLGAAYPEAIRSKVLGIHQSAQFAGLVAGGWYGGWMADRFSWRAGFLIAAGVGILYSLVLVRKVPYVPVPARTASSGSTLSHLAGLLSSRCYLAICTAFFCFCAMLWVFYAWYPSFLQERYHLSMAASGFNATIYVQVGCALGVVFGGALADRLSKRLPAARLYVAAAGILLSAPFGYLTFAVHSLDLARLFSAVYGCFAGLMIANIFAGAYDVISARSYGFGAGFLNTVGGVAASVIIFVAGLVRNSIGFAGLLTWVGTACIASAVLLIFVAATRYQDERLHAQLR